MFEIIRNDYKRFLEETGDSRVKNFWLMDDITTTICASVFYIILVKYIGPSLMENRKPLQLKNVLIAHNTFQIILNAYIFYELFEVEWFTIKRIWKCHPVDYSTSASSVRILKAFYVYYLSKFTEYLDTVFFMLRKKNNQISFLHLFHHASMPIWMWLAVKFSGGGTLVFVPLLNSFVHVVMYTYYLLSGLGPQVQKYLWWKKYITSLQLVQFVSGVMHFAFAVTDFNPKCNISKPLILLSLFNGILFYILFSKFYKESYCKITPKNKAEFHSRKMQKNDRHGD